MWTYEKKLQFPVNIRKPDPAFAKIVISQIGGPDGELAASMRYLNQRYAMPYDSVRAMLTDIGSEVAKCSSLPPFFLLGFPGSSANI